MTFLPDNNINLLFPSFSIREYWEKHTVNSVPFNSSDESLSYFHWRNDQYFNYIKLMPVTNQDNKIILDYGCGPGNDLTGFGIYSKPKKIIAADISSTSINLAKHRTSLHNIQVDFILLNENKPEIPLETDSVDYIHCSGVLHHIDVETLPLILKEFRRVLKVGGTGRIMVYNYYSLWMHLYVAYQKLIVEGLYSDLSLYEAFSKTTDGEDCPISRAYKSIEFISEVQKSGLDCTHLGTTISMYEMSLLHKRYEAVMNQLLPEESRRFLLNLSFDGQGFPLFEGHYAGIGNCFLIRKI